MMTLWAFFETGVSEKASELRGNLVMLGWYTLGITCFDIEYLIFSLRCSIFIPDIDFCNIVMNTDSSFLGIYHSKIPGTAKAV